MRRYLSSWKNIVGCGFAIAGPALALAGVVSGVVGLALVPMMYAIGALATPPRPDAPTDAPPVRHRDVERALDDVLWRSAGRVPAETHRKVVAIAATIREALPQVRASSTSAADEYLLVQCAVDYLPTAVDAYLRLPPVYAREHDVGGGKTPVVLLAEQVELLERQMRTVAGHVHRAETDKLVVNGRFLHDKFGSGRLDP
jgi:hypothetical protein